MSDEGSEIGEALAATLGTLRPKLHRYCARMIGSAMDAEDIVQHVLLTAQEKLPQAPVQNTEAWLMRVAHNKAIDHLRATSRYQTTPLEEIDVPGNEPPALEAQETAKVALSLFLQLTPLQRACVILKDILGYSLAEMAEMLDEQSVGSIKAALSRGRWNLRRMGACTTDDQVAPLAPEEAALLRLYAKLFQDRDIVGIQKMLIDDVRLDLVAMVRAKGKARVGKYFTNYRALETFSLTVGQVEGRPGLFIDDGTSDPFIVVLGFQDGRIASIRDFHFARYATDTMEFSPLS